MQMQYNPAMQGGAPFMMPKDQMENELDYDPEVDNIDDIIHS
jgi:hypothetical protein